MFFCSIVCLDVVGSQYFKKQVRYLKENNLNKTLLAAVFRFRFYRGRGVCLMLDKCVLGSRIVSRNVRVVS